MKTKVFLPTDIQTQISSYLSLYCSVSYYNPQIVRWWSLFDFMNFCKRPWERDESSNIENHLTCFNRKRKDRNFDVKILCYWFLFLTYIWHITRDGTRGTCLGHQMCRVRHCAGNSLQHIFADQTFSWKQHKRETLNFNLTLPPYHHTVTKVHFNGINIHIQTHTLFTQHLPLCVLTASLMTFFFIFLRSLNLKPPLIFLPLSRKLGTDHYTIILLTNDINLPRVLSVAFF